LQRGLAVGARDNTRVGFGGEKFLRLREQVAVADGEEFGLVMARRMSWRKALSASTLWPTKFRYFFILATCAASGTPGPCVSR